ncbi:hypothetical protein ACEQ8H_004909 [Pleosporales sp. CAS-2024a]
MTDKNGSLRLSDSHGAISSRDEERPASTAPTRAGRAVRSVLCVIIILLGFARIYGLLEPKENVPLSITERAKMILKENPLIDGHNDLMWFMSDRYKNHIYDTEFGKKFQQGGLPQHVDIPRLEEGMQGGAFWSAFWPCPLGNDTDFSDAKYAPIVKATLGQLDLFQRLGQQYPKYFTPSKTSAQALKAFSDGLFIAPAAIEGLHQIGNSISTLRLYHQLGVKYATLTWNCHNRYADAALIMGSDYVTRIATPYWHGLSPDGRLLVKEMNRLGMLVDLSHVSQNTMRDALVGNDRDASWNGSIAPPIFSHSSAYALCPHPRNVPDDILHLVKKRNSLVMVNFSPDFVSCKPGKTATDLPIFVPENATLLHVVKHIMHIGELIGYDHVGIGTDYDGIEETPKGLEDVSKFPDLIAELLRQGVRDEDVAKVAGRNLLRVWAEADRVAAELQKTTTPLEEDAKDPWVREGVDEI